MKARFEREIRIDRSVEEVFEAWASAEAFGRWFAPMAVSPPEIEMDFREGGRYELRMALGPNHVHVTRGHYTEISPPRRLRFTWHCDAFADRPTAVTVTFDPVGEGTVVRLVHEGFQSAEAAEGQTMGWMACTDALKAFLESDREGRPNPQL